MQILNTQGLIINSIVIKNNKRYISYSKHLGHGNYNYCIKAIPKNAPLL